MPEYAYYPEDNSCAPNIFELVMPLGNNKGFKYLLIE